MMWPSSANDNKEQANGQTYGMTSPISTSPPKPIDEERTKELEKVLIAYGVTESEDELYHR